MAIRFSARYGIGNCDPMTDIALLEALWRKLPAAYVQFQGTGVEELNGLAIGNWPAAGAYLIIPWAGERGKVFRWQGSIETTPEISQCYSHETVRTVFSVRDPQEIMKFHKLLSQCHYPSWLKVAKRCEILSSIEQNKTELLKSLLSVNKMKWKDVKASREEVRASLRSVVSMWTTAPSENMKVVLDYLQLDESKEENKDDEQMDVLTRRAVRRAS